MYKKAIEIDDTSTCQSPKSSNVQFTFIFINIIINYARCKQMITCRAAQISQEEIFYKTNILSIIEMK